MKRSNAVRDLILGFCDLATSDIEVFAESLVSLERAQAERLRNAIMVAQQERDLKELRDWSAK